MSDVLEYSYKAKPLIVRACLALFGAKPGKIRLTATELLAPKHAFTRKPMRLAFRDIVDVEVITLPNRRVLSVHHSTGKLSVEQSLLPHAEAFEKLHAALIAAVNRVHAPRVNQAA